MAWEKTLAYVIAASTGDQGKKVLWYFDQVVGELPLEDELHLQAAVFAWNGSCTMVTSIGNNIQFKEHQS